MEKVKVGIVGAGIGKVHARGLRSCQEGEPYAICDLNEERAKQVAAEFDIPHVFTDYNKMFAMDELDAITVATPNALHAPIVEAAFAAGKHVMCEKPLSISAKVGKQMVEAGKESGKIFMMGFNNRFRGDSQLLKKFIENGDLGEIYYAKTGWVRRKCLHWLSGWFSTKELSGGGPLIDLGVHVLDLTLWLMGNPRPVSVMGSTYAKFGPERFAGTDMTYDVEDLAAGFIKFENGATVVLEASWESHIEKEHFYSELVGTQGGASLEPLKIYKDIYGAASDINPEYDESTCKDMGHRMEIVHFVDCIRGKCECISTGEHGLHIMQILDAIYESAKTGKSVDIA